MAKKILVIDDEPLVLQMLKARLEANQYDVCLASDGDEGLKKVDSDGPDLVILDVMMPKMDGYTFVKELRSSHLDKTPPIIVLTAKTKMKELFELEGVTDYITKPFEADQLLEMIKKHLG